MPLVYYTIFKAKNIKGKDFLWYLSSNFYQNSIKKKFYQSSIKKLIYLKISSSEVPLKNSSFEFYQNSVKSSDFLSKIIKILKIDQPDNLMDNLHNVIVRQIIRPIETNF